MPVNEKLQLVCNNISIYSIFAYRTPVAVPSRIPPLVGAVTLAHPADALPVARAHLPVLGVGREASLCDVVAIAGWPGPRRRAIAGAALAGAVAAADFALVSIAGKVVALAPMSINALKMQ